MKKTHKRISAAVLSLALGFSVAGAPALAPMAGAQAIEINAGDISTVDATADASLTIEKYEGFPTDDPSELGGLAATFTVQKVSDIDLTTQEGWAVVNGLIAEVDGGASAEDAIAVAGLTLDPGPSRDTENDGNGVFTTTFNLDVGVYLVSETTPEGFQASAPFFVTLPSLNSDGPGWDYNPTVQPKNQQDTRVVKDVDDELAALGTVSNYTIEMAIPDEADLNSVRINDVLPAELDNLANVAVYHTAVDALNEITAVTNNSGSDVLDLLIEDPAALDALKGRTLVVTFDAEIVAAPTPEPGNEGGVIENEASVDIVIDGVTYDYTTDPDDPTETRLGTLRITKVDADEDVISGAPDQSAEFELWRCTDQDEDDRWELGAGPLEMGLTESKQTIFATDSGTGVATIENVQMIDFVNDTEITDYAQEGTICVVETKAPAGYVLNPEPQPVTIAGSDYTMSVDVINLDDTIDGQLPSTGGMGTMAMIAGGLLVAAAGGAAALRGNRARR